MNFTKGETILVEVSNGYRWEGTVVQHIQKQGEKERFDEHALLVDLIHPAMDSSDSKGRGYVDLKTATLESPYADEDFDIEHIWRTENI